MPPDEPPPLPVVAMDKWGGTKGYIAPEANRKMEPGMRLRAQDKQPADMWALGIMLFQVLSGNACRAPPDDYNEKRSLHETELRALWHGWMKKAPCTSIPDEWIPALEFLKDLLELQPEKRLTAAEALQHPFIKLADKFRSDEIPGLGPTGAKRRQKLTAGDCGHGA